MTLAPSNGFTNFTPGRPDGPRPFIGYKTAADLEAEREAKEAAERAITQQPVLDSLAAHIKKADADAVAHRNSSGVTDRLTACALQCDGKYSAEKLARIREFGGDDTFYNITGTKRRSAIAFIQEVIEPIGESPFDLRPTTEPELPEEIQEQIRQKIVQEWAVENPGAPATAIIDATLELYDDYLSDRRKEAEKSAKRKMAKIQDQMDEGGFRLAFREFIDYLCTYPYAVLVGPEVRSSRRLRWNKSSRKPEIIEKSIPTWRACNPKDFYASPNSSTIEDGYICEHIHYSHSALSAMRGVEGWNAKEIDSVLEEGSRIESFSIPGDAERREIENKPSFGEINSATEPKSDAVSFWGPVRGQMLREWGMSAERVPDENKFYQIHGILIGSHVVKAILNPDPLGRSPYFVTSWDKVAGSLIGKALAEQMADCQNAHTAALRNGINNLAMASGPIIAADVASCDQKTLNAILHPHPYMVCFFDSTKIPSPTRKAIEFWQPQDNSGKLFEVAEYFDKKADDRTEIPRIVQGNGDMAGAGSTASGLGMILKMATRGIKRVLANIDADILEPAIQRIHDWNMIYDEKFAALQGDVQVVASGILATLVREVTHLRRQEFLDRTNNDADLQIIGVKGRATVLRAIAKDLELPVKDVVPTDEQLAARMKQQQEAAAAAAAMTEQPAAPQPQPEVQPVA